MDKPTAELWTNRISDLRKLIQDAEFSAVLDRAEEAIAADRPILDDDLESLQDMWETYGADAEAQD